MRSIAVGSPVRRTVSATIRQTAIAMSVRSPTMRWLSVCPSAQRAAVTGPVRAAAARQFGRRPPGAAECGAEDVKDGAG